MLWLIGVEHFLNKSNAGQGALQATTVYTLVSVVTICSMFENETGLFIQTCKL